MRFATLLTKTMLGLALAASLSNAQAATITIINGDGNFEGLNDPTPILSAETGTSTTLGAMRLHALRHGAAIWSRYLGGNGEIKVLAKFDPLPCSTTSAVLGRAGTLQLAANFPNAPYANTAYPIALANILAGRDLNGVTAEIRATFNSDIDRGCYQQDEYFWYGIDRPSPDPRRIDFLPVVLHEFAHGLGFLLNYSLERNGWPAVPGFSSGMPDIFSRKLYDLSLNPARGGTPAAAMSGGDIRNMTAHAPNVVWAGRNLYAFQSAYLAAPSFLTVWPPSALAGDYRLRKLPVGGPISAIGERGHIAAAQDAADAQGPSATDGCSALTNRSQVFGRIALVDRGGCDPAIKALNVQAAGAVAMLIQNSTAGFQGATLNNPRIVIPTFSLEQATGRLLRQQLATGAAIEATINRNGEVGFAGTTNTFLRIDEASLSHFSIDAEPDMLMQPSANPRSFDQLDLAPELLYDLGWPRPE